MRIKLPHLQAEPRTANQAVCCPAFRLPLRARTRTPDGPRPQAKACTTTQAFTLLEVLIAIGLFFMVAFAILQMLVVGLGAARSLQVRHADVGMFLSELAVTNNILEEGTVSGDFGDFFPGGHWEYTATEVGSNGLFQVDVIVTEKTRRGEIISPMSILLYRPGSPKGRMSGGTGKSTTLQPR
jgi:hypothetical protein